jgi:polysaccharide export outer membrane protein
MSGWATQRAVQLFFLVALPLISQVSRPVVDTVIAAPNPTTSLPDHKIVPNDLIQVSVFDEPEFSRAVRVGEDGNIILPMLGKPVAVKGLFPRELEAVLTGVLVDEQLLVHPLVSVSIMEYATKQISVIGDVKIPGQFNITAPITLLEALAKAGWTTTEAGSELLYAKSTTDTPRKIRLEELQNSTDPTINVMLTGGEIVNVPDAPKVWVTGNVTHPQAVPVRRPGDATVLKVVANVEGLTPYYAKVAYIYRPDPADGGKRKEIPVALKDIMHRKKQDVVLLADDILLIPDDGGYLRRQILAEMQTLSGGAASALIYLGIH